MWESIFPPFVPWPVLLGVDDYRSGCSQLQLIHTDIEPTNSTSTHFISKWHVDDTTHEWLSLSLLVYRSCRWHAHTKPLSLLGLYLLLMNLICTRTRLLTRLLKRDFVSRALYSPWDDNHEDSLSLLEMLLMSYRVKQSRLFSKTHHCHLYQLWQMIVISHHRLIILSTCHH